MRGSPVVWGCHVSPRQRDDFSWSSGQAALSLSLGPPLLFACCVTLGKCLSLSGSIRTARSFTVFLNFLETRAANQTRWF